MKSVPRKAFVVGVVALAGLQLGCSSDQPPLGVSTDFTDEGAGSVGMALTLPDAENIDLVEWTITGPNAAATVVLSGLVNVGNSQSVQFLIGGIPVGTGFIITLGAHSTDGRVTCAGSAAFDIAAGAPTETSIQLQCHAQAPEAGSLRASAATSNCATVTAVSSSPSRVTLGSSVALSSTAVGPDPGALTYSWSAPSGSFGAPNAANTSFTCTALGPTMVTVAVGDGPVADGGSCDPLLDTATIVVQCDAPSDAGVNSSTSEAMGFAIDPAHDNAQPNDIVASPLRAIWTAQFAGPVSYPVVTGHQAIVAVAESQTTVRSLDLTTGDLVWGPVVLGSPVTLAYDRGRVFALDRNGQLTALDVTTGQQLWATTLKGQSFYFSPPVAIGGLIYVNGLGVGGTTFAIDENTGATLWTAGTFDGTFGAVAVAAGVVYVAEACDQLTAFDAATGTRNWFHSGNCTGGGGNAPAIYQGLIWERDVAMGNVIIDNAGNSVGSFSANVVPAFHAGTAFYANFSVVSAVELQSKTLKWSFGGDGQICTSPVVAGGNGQVFVGSQSGNVYEVDENTGTQRSVNNAGTAVTCGSETQSMTLASDHLLVPAGNKLVAY